jgi:N6-adenosine-specific RNA methylase IME4
VPRPEGPFDLILADWPWKYSESGAIRRFKGTRKARAEDHYETMTVEAMVDEFKPMLDGWAAPDCALLSWGTWPKFPDHVDLLRGLGFDYVTGLFVWAKSRKPVDEDQGFLMNPDFSRITKPGLGYYCRLDTEYVTFSRRGMPPLPLDRGVGQTIFEPVGDHSAKPAESYVRIERLWPEARRLEMFARRTRPGWAAFGDQVDKPTGPQAKGGGASPRAARAGAAVSHG